MKPPVSEGQDAGTKSDRIDRQVKRNAGSHNRKLINYLLQPYLQSKIGLYSNALALAFAFLVISVLYFHMRDLVEEIILLTDAREEVYLLAERELRGVKIWLFFGTIVFLIGNVAMSIYQTHRFVGPTVAFRRQIRDLANGEYTRRITLRRGDAFNEVAYELNRLAHILDEGAQKPGGMETAKDKASREDGKA